MLKHFSFCIRKIILHDKKGSIIKLIFTKHMKKTKRNITDSHVQLKTQIKLSQKFVSCQYTSYRWHFKPQNTQSPFRHSSYRCNTFR